MMDRLLCRSAGTWPPRGSIVSAPFIILFRHVGIVSDRWVMGKPMVISNSASSGGVREEPWDVFRGGLPVTFEGYPSELPPHEVLWRARSLVGTRYSLRTWNCDHFVRYAHGLPVESPQVAGAILALVIGTTLTLASRR